MDSNSQSQTDALAEGRRIYIGNLLYIIKPHDVEQMLIDNGFADIEKIHISVDPVSARNPGYCFVDFTNRPSAEQALTSLNASIQGRYVKVGPCEPKKQGKRAYGEDRNAFQRWGDWSVGPGNTTETTGDKPNLRGGQQGPHNAISHFEDMKQDHDGRRLFVGGLSKMINQAHNSAEMMEIFADFSPTAIGKRITPHESTRSKPGNHHYCFVDFETRNEADIAAKALNGKDFNGSCLKVNVARSLPRNLMERGASVNRQRFDTNTWRPKNIQQDRPQQDDSQQERAPGSNRAMSSNNWRRQ